MKRNVAAGWGQINPHIVHTTSLSSCMLRAYKTQHGASTALDSMW